MPGVLNIEANIVRKIDSCRLDVSVFLRRCADCHGKSVERGDELGKVKEYLFHLRWPSIFVLVRV